MIQKAIGRLFGKPEFVLPLEEKPADCIDLEVPDLLHFSLCQTGRDPLRVQVKEGDEVTAGQCLASDGNGHVLPTPVTGVIASISDLPDIRGSRKGGAIAIRPGEEEAAGAFPPLDPVSASPADLVQRLREAGILSSRRGPQPLHLDLVATDEDPIDTVVILAADRDPGVSVALQLLGERRDDLAPAAALLGRITGAPRIVVAVIDSARGTLGSVDGVEVIGLPARYPQTLVKMVLRRLGGSAGKRIVPIETALAALDAVRKGTVQHEKVLTLIGPDQKPVTNYRVKLGTRLREVLNHAGIEVGDRDKVIAGGPMRGFAVWSLDGVVDAGLDALCVVPAGTYSSWTAEPCINCGRCIDICPVNLQVQLIARYAEFEIFDRTKDFEIHECFECGLCASVCTARRPLLQYVRLAKRGLEESA